MSHPQVIPIRFDVWCEDCQVFLGISVGRDNARRAANAHHKADRARLSLPRIGVHEAKLEVKA